MPALPAAVLATICLLLLYLWTTVNPCSFHYMDRQTRSKRSKAEPLSILYQTVESCHHSRHFYPCFGQPQMLTHPAVLWPLRSALSQVPDTVNRMLPSPEFQTPLLLPRLPGCNQVPA